MLIAYFLTTGEAFVERDNLSLQQCAAHAAMTRADTSDLYQQIGEVRYLCLPEGHAIANVRVQK